MMLKTVLFAVLTTAFLIGLNFAVSAQTEFTVRVENIANGEGLTATDGSKYPFALSPGLYVVSKERVSLFTNGQRASMGIESQAEDGNPGILALEMRAKVRNGEFGLFNKPVGTSMPSPITPGGAFEFRFRATKGAKLNFALMFGQSNDLFYSYSKPVELFSGGKPVTGDITDGLMLWDAGTEVNQAPGLGSEQGPRQMMANTGTVENGVVRLVNDGFSYPDTKSVMRVTITARQ